MNSWSVRGSFSKSVFLDNHGSSSNGGYCLNKLAAILGLRPSQILDGPFRPC